MGTALISLTNVLDPEIFVIGGGVSRSWALIQPNILETLRSSPFIKPARRPRLRRARLGDRAGQVEPWNGRGSTSSASRREGAARAPQARGGRASRQGVDRRRLREGQAA